VTARLFRIPITVLLAIQFVQAQKTLPAADAKNHIGEATTVCGQVASTHHATKTRGSPTFINLDKSYPNEIFTVLIWGSDRSKFGNPDQEYRKKHICATGNVTDYKGVPEIVAHEPAQIKIR
jgi:hypothetical protein